MEQREKLIELIGNSLCCPKETDCADCEYKKYELCTETMVADYLLANGIVVLPCRCGECEHHHWEQEPCHGKIVHYCDLPKMRGVEIYKDFFCTYAKRKGGDE